MKHFEELLLTLGFSNIDPRMETEAWAFWSAEYATPIGKLEANYLHLKARCTQREANPTNIQKWAELSKSGNYTIIVSSKRRPGTAASIQKTFHGQGVKSTKQLLFENLLADLNVRAFEGDEYFINPDIELPDGTSIKDATTFLAKWLLRQDDASDVSKNLAVLKAHGGLGKTTLARALCNRLRRLDNKCIPILVESTYWSQSLPADLKLRNIWDIAITRAFERPSRLLSNEIALRVLIREGILIPIFDGFDELCINPSSAYKAEDLLNEISEVLQADSEMEQARMILTTRETFWDSISDRIDQKNLCLYRLGGFSNEQRKNFFDLRLKKLEERDVASRIASEISGKIYPGLPIDGKNATRPGGVPFILDLIVNYVQSNENVVAINPYEPDPLARLLEAMCQRENIRQNLNIPVEKQMIFFEELFRDFSDSILEENITFYLSAVCDVNDSAIVSRFSNHVFLTRTGPGVFVPRYEVLRVYFLARFLAKGLENVRTGSERESIVKTLAENSGGSTQVLDYLMGHFREFSDTRLINAFRQATAIIRAPEARGQFRKAAAALFHIATRLITDGEKSARAARLTFLLAKDSDSASRKALEDFVFVGPIAAMDLTATTISKCIIADAAFKNCIFDHTTVFIDCIFEGYLEFGNCEGVEKINLQGSTVLSNEAELTFSGAAKRQVRIEIRKKFAYDSLMSALKKFRGQFGLAAIQYRRRANGFAKANPYNVAVWDALLKYNIVQRHEISGVTEGGLNLTQDTSLRKEVGSFIDNGVIGPTLKKVSDAIVKE